MFANLTLSYQAKILMTAATDLSTKGGNYFRRTIPGSWVERNDATQSRTSSLYSKEDCGGRWGGEGAALEFCAQHKEVAFNFRRTPKFSLFHSDMLATDTSGLFCLGVLYYSTPYLLNHFYSKKLSHPSAPF